MTLSCRVCCQLHDPNPTFHELDKPNDADHTPTSIPTNRLSPWRDLGFMRIRALMILLCLVATLTTNVARGDGIWLVADKSNTRNLEHVSGASLSILDGRLKELAGPIAVNCGRVKVSGDVKGVKSCMVRPSKARRPFVGSFFCPQPIRWSWKGLPATRRAECTL